MRNNPRMKRRERVLKLVTSNRIPINKSQMKGESIAFKEAMIILYNYAKTNQSILISGETGVGKELAARYAHKHSDRAGEPFIVVDCASGPEGLLEAKLFGARKGSYTGSIENTVGSFESADGGTIFLDEIGELPPESQKKLLRVIQEREFSKVGESIATKVDVRIIAATNKNLLDEVKKGTFRKDLYYRLGVLPIELPPLRERGEDIIILADYFLEKLKCEYDYPEVSLSDEAKKALMGYDWPGNIRELENYIARAAALSKGKEIRVNHIVFNADKLYSPQSFEFNHLINPEGTLKIGLDEFKRQRVIMALASTKGNRSAAAKLLDIQRTYLSRLISQYAIVDDYWKNINIAKFSNQPAIQDDDEKDDDVILQDLDDLCDELEKVRKELEEVTEKLKAKEVELESQKSVSTELGKDFSKQISESNIKAAEFFEKAENLQLELEKNIKLLKENEAYVVVLKSEIDKMDERGKNRSIRLLETLNNLNLSKQLIEKYQVGFDVFQKTINELAEKNYSKKTDANSEEEIYNKVISYEWIIGEYQIAFDVLQKTLDEVNGNLFKEEFPQEQKKDEVEIKIEENLDSGQCQKDVKVAKKKGGWPKGKKRKIEPKINPSSHEEKGADPISESDKGTEAQAEPKKRGRKFGSKDKVKRKSRNSALISAERIIKVVEEA